MISLDYFNDLKKNAALREGIARRGFDLVNEHYSPRAVGERLLEIIIRRFYQGK